jgi:hypothetical protein
MLKRVLSWISLALNKGGLGVRPCFREPFGEGSRRTPASLTPIARVLDAIVRRTLLPRLGYREGLTHM